MLSRNFVVLVLSIFPTVRLGIVPVATIHPAVQGPFTATSVTTATIHMGTIRIIRIILTHHIPTIRRRRHLRRTSTVRTPTAQARATTT
jgi:hypothetical protein